MNATTRSNEVSGYCKQINGTTAFYSFPHDVETTLQKGMNAIHSLAKTFQRSTNNSHDSNKETFNDTVT